MSVKDELYARPGHLIRRLQQIAVALFMEETKEFDVTPVQYCALLAVKLHPGLDQIGLASAIAFDRSTIANVVERLEAKELLTRKSGSEDRRTKLLYITLAGKKLLDRLTPRVNATQNLILEGLKPDERRMFLQLMRQIVDAKNGHSRAPMKVGAIHADRSNRERPAEKPNGKHR